MTSMRAQRWEDSSTYTQPTALGGDDSTESGKRSLFLQHLWHNIPTLASSRVYARRNAESYRNATHE